VWGGLSALVTEWDSLLRVGSWRTWTDLWPVVRGQEQARGWAYWTPSRNEARNDLRRPGPSLRVNFQFKLPIDS
jgi:hypothetical protein